MPPARHRPTTRSQARSSDVSVDAIHSDGASAVNNGSSGAATAAAAAPPRGLGNASMAAEVIELERMYQQAADDAERADEEAMFEEGDLDQDDHDASPTRSSLPPRGLKEISSLASWTVSTSKPGCGVAALRNASTDLFWQSDGPQPHLLSIHFFKLVSIVHMRIFLDFDNDESYTPTKMQFLAGMGVYDVLEFAEMSFEQPRGWIDVDFSGVGKIEDDHAGDMSDDEEQDHIDWDKRPVLKCFLLQVRIMENHQNGKDTHLRGLQIFARDTEGDGEKRERIEDEVDRSAHSLGSVEMPLRSKRGKARKKSDAPGLKQASWMVEPELR